MRNRFFSPAHNHQIVVSLSPRSLHTLHFRRSVIGWRRVNGAQTELPEGDGNLEQILSQLKLWAAKWNLPAAARVHWILASDILGVISSPNAQGPQAALPFSSADTRTQTDRFVESPNASLLWIHNDWVAELERISAACGWELVELFARAQLFQREAAATPASLTSILEQEEDAIFLHIFGPEGGILRSTIVDRRRVAAFEPVLQAELAAVAGSLPPQTRPPLILASEALGQPHAWGSLQVEPLRHVAHDDRLEKLWRSGTEGIVVRPTHGGIVKRIKTSSAMAALAGLVAFSVMAWHDGRLEDRITAARAQERTEAPKVKAAKLLNNQTRLMSDAVRAVQIFRGTASAFDAFRLILANLPPVPAALMYVRIDQDSLEFAATGTQESVDWLKGKAFPGYEALVDSPVPDFLKDTPPLIHVKAHKVSAVISGAQKSPVSQPDSNTTTGKP